MHAFFSRLVLFITGPRLIRFMLKTKSCLFAPDHSLYSVVAFPRILLLKTRKQKVAAFTLL